EMCSILSGWIYSGYCLTRFPKFDMCGGPPCLSARFIHAWIGWLVSVVAILVIVRRILSVRRHLCGARAVSCSMAVIAVVRKQPVMARMIRPCIIPGCTPPYLAVILVECLWGWIWCPL